MDDELPAAATAKTQLAEHDMALVRALVVAFNSVVYAVFLYPQGIPALAWTMVVVANLYALYVLLARPYERFPGMTSSTFTALTDGALIALWIVATGGLDSPFYLLWYLSLVAVAFRFDARATMLTAILYTAAYVALAGAMGQAAAAPVDLALRCGYILLMGVLAAQLAGTSSRAIGDRVRLEADLARSERFRVLAEASSEGVMVHREGRILAANAALGRVLGRDPEDVLGQHVLSLVHPDERPRVLERLAQPTSEDIEFTLVHATGRPVPIVARGRDIPLGDGKARVVTVRDISKEREAEEVRRAARDREGELERLRELDRMRTTFINTAAHELNTPLTPIRLQLHMLRQSAARDPKEKRVLEMLERNLQRLSRLVNDMLDVSRLQEGRLRLMRTDVDLSDTATQAVETFTFQAKDQDVGLAHDIDAGVHVHGDRQRLEQVLANLLSNAIRFTPSGGRIMVRVRRDGGEAVLEVEDTGAGMDEAQHAGLFHPFSQGHPDMTAAGLGLGLYITKGIVEGHGGTITIRSPGPGKGTTATVRIPVEPDEEA